jgi:hypothetical protein
MGCRCLREFIDAEVALIERHIDKHKWFQHIDNKDEAIADFITKYGWIMRECYCKYKCPYSEECEIDEDNL